MRLGVAHPFKLVPDAVRRIGLPSPMVRNVFLMKSPAPSPETGPVKSEDEDATVNTGGESLPAVGAYAAETSAASWGILVRDGSPTEALVASQALLASDGSELISVISGATDVAVDAAVSMADEEQDGDNDNGANNGGPTAAGH